MGIDSDASFSQVIGSLSMIVILSLVVILMILYYINRKWFNRILKDLAGKIDPDGETPHIDELPKLYKKEKLEFQKVYRTPMRPRMNQPQTPHQTQQTPYQQHSGGSQMFRSVPQKRKCFFDTE